MSRWTAGVRAFNPSNIAGTLTQVASVETLKEVAIAGAGIATPIVAPMLISKLTGRVFTSTMSRLVGGGAALAGFVALSLTRHVTTARLFLAGALGSMVAEYILNRFVLGTSSVSGGIGAVADEVRRTVEREVSRTLAQSGIGNVSAQEVAELGGVSLEEVDELAGFGNVVQLE
jgi:hypothetical protein